MFDIFDQQLCLSESASIILASGLVWIYWSCIRLQQMLARSAEPLRYGTHSNSPKLFGIANNDDQLPVSKGCWTKSMTASLCSGLVVVVVHIIQPDRSLLKTRRASIPIVDANIRDRTKRRTAFLDLFESRSAASSSCRSFRSCSSCSNLFLFFFFGLPPAMWPFRFRIRSFPLRPRCGRWRIIAPPDPFAVSPASTLFLQAACPPMVKKSNCCFCRQTQVSE